MARAVLAVLTAELVDDGGGHGGAEEGGRPGRFFDLVAEGVGFVGGRFRAGGFIVFRVWVFSGARGGFGDLDPLAEGEVAVGDEAAAAVGEADQAVDYGVLEVGGLGCVAEGVGLGGDLEGVDDADGGEGDGHWHCADGGGTGIGQAGGVWGSDVDLE